MLAEADLDALLELSESLLSSEDIERSLLRVTQRLTAVFSADRCSLILLDDESRHGYIIASSDNEALKNHRINLEVYPEIREVLRTGEPLTIDDVPRAPLLDEVREIIRDKPLGAMVLFPVRIDRHVQGILLIRKEKPCERPLTQREIRFGRIVANAIGSAIRNIRHHETIRDHSERRIRQIEKYQRFFDYAGDGLMIVDQNGRALFSNRAAQAILGYTDQQIERSQLVDFVSRRDRALARLMIAIRERRELRDLDLQIVRKNGEEATLSLNSAPLDEPDTEPKLHVLSFRDVTQTREMEEELRTTKDFLMNVIASSADAIVAADMRGKILIFNPAAERILGYNADNMIGRSVVALYPSRQSARKVMSELRSEEHGGPGGLEEHRQHLVAQDGAQIPINLAASIVYDQGKEVATVGIFSDLRERIRMEEALTKAQQKIELSERQSAIVELAGAVAHELNQPLTTIIGYAELMQRKVPLNSPLIRSLEMIVTEGERMAEMVRKLGRITKYETKHYLGETDIVDLDASSQDLEKES